MTAQDVFEAGRLWNSGKDTADIAEALGVPESIAYRRIGAICAAAMAQRNAERKTAA